MLNKKCFENVLIEFRCLALYELVHCNVALYIRKLTINKNSVASYEMVH